MRHGCILLMLSFALLLVTILATPGATRGFHRGNGLKVNSMRSHVVNLGEQHNPETGEWLLEEFNSYEADDDKVLTPRRSRGSKGTPKPSLKETVFFQANGHLMLRDILPEARKASFVNEATKALIPAEKNFLNFALYRMDCPDLVVLNDTLFNVRQAFEACRERNPDAHVPYVQYLHLDRHSRSINSVSRGSRLARAAQALLQSPTVMLYQTAGFVKEAQQGETSFNDITAWHQDLNMVPVDTNDYVTFWCPLVDLDQDIDSVLHYASGSHRDVSLSYWFPPTPMYPTKLIKSRYRVSHYSDIRVGDCVAHHGWTWHMAPRNGRQSQHRIALTFSYIGGASRVLASGARRGWKELSSEDEVSYSRWRNDVSVMQLLRTATLPIVAEDTRFPSPPDDFLVDLNAYKFHESCNLTAFQEKLELGFARAGLADDPVLMAAVRSSGNPDVIRKAAEARALAMKKDDP